MRELQAAGFFSDCRSVEEEPSARPSGVRMTSSMSQSITSHCSKTALVVKEFALLESAKGRVAWGDEAALADFSSGPLFDSRMFDD